MEAMIIFGVTFFLSYLLTTDVLRARKFSCGSIQLWRPTIWSMILRVFIVAGMFSFGLWIVYSLVRG